MTHRRFPDGPPDGLLDLDARSLLRELGGPTWFRLPGTGEAPPRAVSTLLHGDESTGIHALLHVLGRRRVFPFDLHVVLFNVEAALAGPGFAHRYLDHQEDGNRVWGLGDPAVSPDRRAADAILGDLLADDLDLLVDVHNTTGDNPFHAVVPSRDPAVVNLATRFTTTLLVWELGNGTLMEAVTEHAPAVAVECGLAGRRTSHAFAVDGLRRAFGPPLERGTVVRDHDLVTDLQRVRLVADVRARFGGELDDEVDVVLPPDGDAVNLVPVPAGHALARVRPGAPSPFTVTAPDGADVTADALAVRADGTVVSREPRVPVMIVRSVEAARKDCYGYLGAGSARA